MSTAQRKDSHLELAATGEVEPPENRTLFECVQLMHCALPELALGEIDISASLFGKKLRAPVLISGMTGGTARGRDVNQALATLAETHGLAFGVGSQRAMLEDGDRSTTFRVRDVAPTAVVLGNLGLRQAAELGPEGALRLVDAIQADGLALHLNAGQELTQAEGDRDFRGGYEAIGRLVKVFEGRLLVKETGCGLSPEVVRRLADLGVRCVDVSGLGGTSWIRVEQLRSRGLAEDVAKHFSGWGIPTAAAVLGARRAARDIAIVASGGIRNGLEMAKAMALGADLTAMALPFYRALQRDGYRGLEHSLEVALTGLRHAMFLTGSRDLAGLKTKPKVITGDLRTWARTFEDDATPRTDG